MKKNYAKQMRVGYEAEQHNNGVDNMSAFGFHPYEGFRVELKQVTDKDGPPEFKLGSSPSCNNSRAAR